MRMLLGFVVGVAITIVGAYAHDSRLPPGSGDRLVNWDAATSLTQWGMDRAREEWARLTAK